MPCGSAEALSRRSPAPRFLALVFPWLSTERLRATRPHLFARAAADPVALIGTVGTTAILHAVDRAAVEAGLNVGTTLAAAHIQVPALATHPHDPAADHDWLEALAAACGRYSKSVSLMSPDALVLTMVQPGCDERALAAEVEHRFARRTLVVRHAFGATPAVAHALARFAGAPAPDEQGAVRRLPIAALDIDAELTAALTAAGLKTVGDVMARPAASLTARFGVGVAAALRPLMAPPTGPTPARTGIVEVERTLDRPIGRLEPVLDLLATLASEAIARLSPGAGACSWEVRLFGADGGLRRLTVETERPVRDAVAIVHALRARLARHAAPLDPEAGHDLIRLSVARIGPLDRHGLALDGGSPELAEPPTPPPVPRRPVRAAAADRADQAQLALPMTASPPGCRTTLAVGAPPHPIHLFDPPEPIAAARADRRDGPPQRFRWRRRLYQITRVHGPDGIAPDPNAPATPRDYYRVEDQRGRSLWIFRHLSDGADAGRWFVHGVFA